jgi:hypothetical protein
MKIGRQEEVTMEFKIKVMNAGHVYLSKVDPDTEKEVADFMLWQLFSRVLAGDKSAMDAANQLAKDFAEFTGFEIVAE